MHVFVHVTHTHTQTHIGKNREKREKERVCDSKYRIKNEILVCRNETESNCDEEKLWIFRLALHLQKKNYGKHTHAIVSTVLDLQNGPWKWTSESPNVLNDVKK